MKVRPGHKQEAAADIAKEAVDTVVPATNLVPDKGDPNFKTAGEKIHKWTTYLGVDWVWNMASGVAFVYFVNYNELGKKIWKPFDWLVTTPSKALIKNEQAQKQSIRLGNTFLSIIIGGLLTIPPLVVLEKNSVRKRFAKFYDRVIYGKDKVEHDPEFQAAYERMGHEEKKDSATGMWARALALAPLAASVWIPVKAGPKVALEGGAKGQEQFMQHHVFNRIARVTDRALDAMHVEPARVIRKISPHISEAEAARRWSTHINKDASPMEIAFDIPYALMHKFWYDTLAKRKGLKDEGVEQHPAVPALADSRFTDRHEPPAHTTSHAEREFARKAEKVTQTVGI